jgi:hypothetical protein
MKVEELMQSLNYASKGRGRDLLMQNRMNQLDPSNLQNMQVLMDNKDLQFVDRILEPGEFPIPSLFEEGKMKTHRMSAEQDKEGNWIVFPNVVLQDGKYIEFDETKDAMDFAKKNKQLINFGKGENAKQRAINFSINYKPEEFKEYYKGLLN